MDFFLAQAAIGVEEDMEQELGGVAVDLGAEGDQEQQAGGAEDPPFEDNPIDPNDPIVPFLPHTLEYGVADPPVSDADVNWVAEHSVLSGEQVLPFHLVEKRKEEVIFLTRLIFYACLICKTFSLFCMHVKNFVMHV